MSHFELKAFSVCVEEVDRSSEMDATPSVIICGQSLHFQLNPSLNAARAIWQTRVPLSAKFTFFESTLGPAESVFLPWRAALSSGTVFDCAVKVRQIESRQDIYIVLVFSHAMQNYFLMQGKDDSDHWQSCFVCMHVCTCISRKGNMSSG
jgi:hypothetical protein